MEHGKQNLWLPALTAVLLTLFFSLLYVTDNKYKTPPPYGRDGVIALSEADFENRHPLFLIDGWLLTDDQTSDRPTYIGEFSNLRRGGSTAAPHGTASYRITLRYSGADMEAVLSFPQLYSAYIISLDGRQLAEGSGSAKLSFTLTQGDHLLTVQTVSKQGYYSGMYHPPMIGRTQSMAQALFISSIAYSAAFFVPLALALFTLTIWRTAGDKISFWFGLLCISFSLYVSYYFVRLLNLPLGEWWYLIQSAAFYGLCFCVLRLTALTLDKDSTKPAVWIYRILTASSVLLLVLAVLIPTLPWMVRLHGILTNAYYLFVFSAVLLLMLGRKTQQTPEGRFTLLACTVFGGGLLMNWFSSNLFEPILFFWQFEWCGLFLVALFGVMMATRNKRLLAENLAFSQHLEELVQLRTEELQNLLKERKAFFSDMAHDLKAPIYATRTFIQAIREHDTGVDQELLRYIDQVEQKQQEMARRVQGLHVFNKMDEVYEPWESISVRTLLAEVYETHRMAAEVQSIYLVTEPPDTDGYLFAQPRKLSILFENLIFNALRATPTGGRITIAAELDEEECHLTVADTGNGILFEELPHIFERFYVGNENKATGSGLGLNIAKHIVDELHGEISVSSKPGQGAVFYIDLPLKKEAKN